MRNESFAHSFYKEEETTVPTDFIYDEVYKSASSKNKYSNNPKYNYYNALLTMKQKLSQEQAPVFQSLFHPPVRKASPSVAETAPVQKKNLMPVYHVEKINKMKFKIYKQGTAQYIEKLPVTDLSFQIRVRGEEDGSAAHNSKPRLQQILSQYRKMGGKQPRSRQIRRSVAHGSDLSIKTMRKTMTKIGRSESHRR